MPSLFTVSLNGFIQSHSFWYHEHVKHLFHLDFPELQIPLCTQQPTLYIHLEISDISKVYVYPVFGVGSVFKLYFIYIYTEYI